MPGWVKCALGLDSSETSRRRFGVTLASAVMVLLSCSLAKQDEEADARSPAVIISEATAQRFWPKPDALGQTLRLELDPDDPRCKETSSYQTARVIGIARNVSSGMASADAPNASCLYFPMRARSAGTTSLLIRVKGDAEVARRNLDRMLAQAAPGAIDTMVPMQPVVAALICPFRVGFWGVVISGWSRAVSWHTLSQMRSESVLRTGRDHTRCASHDHGAIAQGGGVGYGGRRGSRACRFSNVGFGAGGSEHL
jgi:hypothetical protein